MREFDFGKALSSGFELFTRHVVALVPAALVAAVVVGVVQVVLGIAQSQLLDVELQDLLSGNGLSKSELGTYQVLSAVGQFVTSVVVLTTVGVLGSLLLRALRSGSDSLEGSALSELQSNWGQVLPTALFISAVVSVLTLVPGLIGTFVNAALGTLLLIAAFVVAMYLSVRWTFSPLAAADDTLDRPSAIARSEALIEGHFWPVLGYAIVAGLCAAVPAAIGLVIVSLILPGVIGVAVGWLVAIAIAIPLASSLVAAAYHQLGGGPGPEADPHAFPERDDAQL